jgi:general secretion pathway protein C
MSTVSWLQGAALPASRAQWVTHAPQIAVWALAAAIGVQAAVIVTGLAGSGASHRPGGQAMSGAPTARTVDLATLDNGHLFGVAPPALVNDANAPLTNMPLILTGIIASTDPKDGLAIIGTSATNTKIYPVGERVPGNARVHAVYTDRVLLERNGAIEALTLPQRFGGAGPAPIAAPGPNAVDRVQRVLSNEPGLISDVLRPQPVFVDGKLHGYRVSAGRNPKAFSSLGLRNGDLVLAINGTALDDPSRGNDIFNSLGNSDQAHVTVLRNGQQEEITLNMSQIANQAEQLGATSGDGTAPGTATPDAAAVPAAVPAPDQASSAPALSPGLGPPRPQPDVH